MSEPKRMEIKNQKGKVLYTAEVHNILELMEKASKSGANLSGAYLCGAYLYGADLYGAYLSGAYLYGANLCGADLCGADLCGANLSGANLYGADLCGANLCGAKGLNPSRSTPLAFLLDQPGNPRAYKVVDAEYQGIYKGSAYPAEQAITYTAGAQIPKQAADTDPTHNCGEGINLSDRVYALQNYKPGYHIMIVEFKATDIACIPMASDGKFRVGGPCKVIGEVDLRDWGVDPETGKDLEPEKEKEPCPTI